ncbi:MAG TPA: hypothetical protein VM282_05570 [Acidimicrobiales bacterium]|nr:hypothetical protein [Acidimicrobiales bacterium]
MKSDRLTRLCTIVCIAGALVLLVEVVAMSQFRAAAAGQRMLDRTRPAVDGPGLAQLRMDVDLGKRVAAEAPDLEAALAGLVGMTTDQFGAIIQRDYPDLATGAAQFTDVVTLTDKAVGNLEARQDAFHAADDLPAFGLPLVSGIIMTIGFAAGLIVFGFLAWHRPSRWPRHVLVGLTTATLLTAFLTNMPDKARQTDELFKSINFERAVAARSRAQLTTVQTALDTLNTKLLPDIAAATGRTRPQLDALLAPSFPSTSQLIAERTTFFDRFDALAVVREKNVADADRVDTAPLPAIVWSFIIVAGAALTASALADFRWRPRQVPSTRSSNRRPFRP